MSKEAISLNEPKPKIERFNALAPETLYRLEDAAAALSIHPRTLQHFMSDGKIGFYKLGNRVRFCRRHLDEFLAASERKPNAREFGKAGKR